MPPDDSKLNDILEGYVDALELITEDNGYHTEVAKAEEGSWVFEEPNNLPGCEVYCEEVNYEHAMGSSQTTGRARIIVTGFVLVAAKVDVGPTLRNFGQDIIKAIMADPRLNLGFVIDTTYTAMAHDQALDGRDRNVERGVEVHFETRFTHDVDEP